MTAGQLHILQHSLGCDRYGISTGCFPMRDENDGCFGYYRNRYVSDPDDDLRQLVLVGIMTDHGPQQLAGGMHCFTVTVGGVKAMRDASPVPPKFTRSQKRWRQYMKVADCFENFRAYLQYEQHQRDTNQFGH